MSDLVGVVFVCVMVPILLWGCWMLDNWFVPYMQRRVEHPATVRRNLLHLLHKLDITEHF